MVGFSEKSVLGHGTLLCFPGTNGVRSLLRQILLNLWSVGSTKADCGSCSGTSFGRCPVMGPNSEVQEPQELGVCKDRCWVLLGHLLSVSVRSWDLTPWSGNHRSWVSARTDVGSSAGTSFRLVPWSGNYRSCLQGQILGCLQGQMLGHARAPPFGQCPVMGPNSMVREPQELGVCNGRCWVLLEHLLSVSTRTWDLTPWSGNHMSCLQGQMLGPARAPPFGVVCKGRCLVLHGHFLWLAWIFHRIDPSPTLVGAQHRDLSQWSAKGRNSTPEVVVVQHSSRGSMVPGEVLPRSTSMVAGKVLPGSSMVPGEVLPGSTSIVSGEVQSGSRGSSTQVNKHCSRGSSFYPGHGEVLPGSTSIVPDEEVLPGSTIIVSEEVQPGSRGSSTRVNKHCSQGSSTRVKHVLRR
ncbi:hypothetical protein TIFTF001_024678 [Ficus carica]|uniref:Uncharacterized protein n=1 Tax=Ficus carica TaxID=3494 RepID=A0AA88AY80_FICCA|nr:hypothetical protein TIFTF001_024678 [Ficus carica]